MNTLGDSLVSVARIDPFCSFDRGDSGLISVSVDWDLADETPEEKAIGEMKTLFLMNPEPETKRVSLEFTHPVRVHGSGAGAEAGENGFGQMLRERSFRRFR